MRKGSLRTTTRSSGKDRQIRESLGFLDEEIRKTEAELQAAEEERISLQTSVDKQGITIQDMIELNTERERLQRSLEDTLARLEDAHGRVMDKEAEASRKLEDLEQSQNL